MVVTVTCALLLATAVAGQDSAAQENPIKVRPATETVAILPFSMQAGTETAVKTAKETLLALFASEGVKPALKADTLHTWIDVLGNRQPVELYKVREYVPDLPRPQELLKLGQQLNVDFVCAGRLTWHSTSKWVGLGPKTKAYAYLDLMLIDVEKKLVLVDAKRIKTDSTRIEKGWETAASILVSGGFTVLSGGPKTPHQQRAAQIAIAMALEPWLKEREVERRTKRRIGGEAPPS